MLGVARVGLLLARFRRPYLGCIPDPQLVSQLGQQPLEPARRSAGFHPHPHRLSRQAAVKLLRLPAVLQSALTPLPSFRIHKSNLLKPRMKITAYNPHVGSFLRALVLFSDNQDTRLGADLIMQSPRTRKVHEGKAAHSFAFFVVVRFSFSIRCKPAPPASLSAGGFREKCF